MDSKMSKTLDTDQISSLPDALICHILSFLPTKYAVATSILSTRWRYIFSSIPIIDLDDSLLLNPHQSTLTVAQIFTKFVYRLLLLRNAPHIHTFILKCHIPSPYDSDTITTWISAVVSRNVQQLHVFAWKVRHEFATLPREILTCKTLQNFKFGGYFLLNVPPSVNLPNLKVLHLEFVKLTDEDSIRRVFSSCYVLEDLKLHKCTLDNIHVLDISIPSLRKLNVSACSGMYDIVLDTPNLENFEYVPGVDGVGGYLVKNLRSLHTADIDAIFSEEQQADENCLLCGQRVVQFINEMHNVESLNLSDSSLDAVYYSRCSLRTFHNLTLMKLGASHICGWRLLPELLESSPNLQVLVFYDGFIDYYGVELEFEYRLAETVPVCLSQHLKEIRIEEFDGQECELQLVEYFLKSGQVLTKMVIGTQSASEWVLPAYDRLSVFPKCSKTCEIVLTWDDAGKSCSKILK